MVNIIKRVSLISALTAAFMLNNAVADTYTPPSGVPAPSFANNFVVIDDVGNADDSRTGYGGVNYKYRVSATQITVGDWVAFLNAVDPSNTKGFDSIESSTGAGSCDNDYCFATYGYSGGSWSVLAFNKDGMNMTAAETAKLPIDWLSLNMVGRYMNWLATGNINQGAFTFSNSTSANATITNFDANYPGPRLPLEDELYKAMYWDKSSGSYNDYPTTNTSGGTPVLASVGANGMHTTNAGGARIPGYGSVGDRHYAQVGQELGNPWNLYDMAGNRHETTLNPAQTTQVILHGAAAFGSVADSRYDFRYLPNADTRYVSVGYRVWMGVSADSGTLSITKAVTGGTDSQSFKLQLNCDDDNFDVSNISLKNGQTYTSDNIPVGVQCTITETTPTPPTGYTYGAPVISPSTVTIKKNQNVAVTVTNPLSTAGCPTITVTPNPLTDGTVGVAYTASPSASASDGNSYTYVWSATSLPAGLSVSSSSGAVSGTPTAAGSATVTASTTVAGQACAGSTPLTVNAAPTQDVDLELTKVADKTNVTSGDTVRYTITVKNKGPGGATGVEVTDNLPSGVTYQATNSVSQGTYNNSTGVWAVGALAKDATATLKIDVTVD